MLTDLESRALELTGELAGLLGRIVSEGPNRSRDLDELLSHVHQIQWPILAQGTARDHPRLYRLLGESLLQGDSLRVT